MGRLRRAHEGGGGTPTAPQAQRSWPSVGAARVRPAHALTRAVVIMTTRPPCVWGECR